jgi:CTD kinase subunit beta
VRDLFSGEEGKKFLRVAYDMSIDLYSTFAPVKQSTFTLVLAIVELTSRLTGVGQGRVSRLDPRKWHTNRGCILETMLDLLDVYTHFPKSTKLGNEFEMKKLMDIKIELNNYIEKQHYHRFETWCEKCKQEAPDVVHPITPGSATSPATSTSLSGGYSAKKTVKSSESSIRFVFDPDEARKERDLVGEYFADEMEEYEVEVEEIIPPEEPRHGPSRNNHGNHGHHRDHGWAPYRSRHGGHGHGHNDRPPKGRKAYYH